MKVKIDVRDTRVTDWLMSEVGPSKFEYNIRSEEVTFHDTEDFLAFRLKFQEVTEDGSGFYYCPYIPDFDYDKKN